jgi:isoleucyl-tRNA synthetase
VEYENHTSPTVYVRFPLKDVPKTSLLIWTTTPWTLLSNVAAAVHPNYTYVYADIGNEVLILEKTFYQKNLKNLIQI